MNLQIKKAAMLLAIVFLLSTVVVLAQNNNKQKSDKIIFVNGNTKEGKVVAFGSEKIEFTHEGESLKYEFAKKDIERIEFASGRTEMLTEKKAEINTSSADSKNKVAVLPLDYTADENSNMVEDMRYRLQEMVITDLSNSAAELKFKDAAEINAILLKKGIDDNTIRQYSPKELASLLQVEYIISGSVLQDRGNLRTVTNNSSYKKESTDPKSDKNKTEQKTRRNISSSTRQDYETHVSVSIYNQNGEKIYTKSRQSILSDKDAYKNALHYLLKRTPLYKR